MSDSSVFKKEYEVNSLLVNFRGQLGLYAILNLLQDIAWSHANVLGLGYESISKQSLIWVLTRQKLVMNKWPKWGEKISIETWIRPHDLYALREFSVYKNDELIGESTTSYVTLNSETRRPVKFDRSGFTNYGTRALEISAEKIPVMAEYQNLISFKVRNSDIDINKHVNNTRYAQWLLDSIPQEWHSGFDLHEYEVNFLAETKLGDEIALVKNPEMENPPKTRWTNFQGIRSSDQKVVFTSRVNITQKT